MMDWNRSYSSTWRIYRVNRKTWADAEILTDVDSVSVTRTADGALLESGSIEVTGEFQPDYYRVVMIAEQGGDVVRADVATMLFDIDSGEHNFGTGKAKAEGHSVLYPASTTSIPIGEYAPAGVDGARYAANLLGSAINAPIEVEGSFILNEHIVHEADSFILDTVWSVLEAGSFVIQIDGRGVVHIRPKPTEPALIIDTAGKGILLNGIEYKSDISEIPNRYIVIDDYSRTTVINDDPNSSVSTVVRGYCVDEVDTSPTPVNGETYGEYAYRKLRELSLLKIERSYKREYAPDVYLYSIIRASIDGLQGDMRVQSQSLECKNGIQVSEKVTEEISLWQ